MSKKENANGNWTLRSKAAVLREQELERQREALQESITRAKEEIAESQKNLDIHAEQVIAKKGSDSTTLDHCLAELRAKDQKLDVWYKQLKRVTKQIESCKPTAEEAAERKKNQDTMAASSEERLKIDRQIHEQLGQLSALLQRRREVSSRMVGNAQALEMENELDLDQYRFDALLDSLPKNVLALSEV